VNWLALVRAGYGASLLAAPHRFGGRSRKEDLTTTTRRSMRILAGRLLFEAAVCAVEPSRCILRLEAVVDAIHAGTMAVVVVASNHRPTRRAAAVNVATAVAFVGADVLTMTREHTAQPRPIARANPLLSTRDMVARRVCDMLPYPAGER
jgi:hypothetical protein